MKSLKLFGIVGALSCALAVILGAFGAHALKDLLNADLLESYHTANRYHLFHSGMLVVLYALGNRLNPGVARLCGFLWITGIVLFSFSIYLLSCRYLFDLPGLVVLGPVTPIGGLLIIAGWVTLSVGIWKYRSVSG